MAKTVKELVKAPIIVDRYAWPFHRPKNRAISSVSRTVEGEAFTIRELMERSIAQGGIQQIEGNYLDAELHEITNMYRQGMDLVDLQAHAEHLKELQQRKAEIDHEAKKRARKEWEIKEGQRLLAEAKANEEKSKKETSKNEQ